MLQKQQQSNPYVSFSGRTHAGNRQPVRTMQHGFGNNHQDTLNFMQIIMAVGIIARPPQSQYIQRTQQL